MLFGIDCYIRIKKKIHMESDLKVEVLHLQGIPGTNKNPSEGSLPMNVGRNVQEAASQFLPRLRGGFGFLG